MNEKSSQQINATFYLAPFFSTASSFTFPNLKSIQTVLSHSCAWDVG